MSRLIAAAKAILVCSLKTDFLPLSRLRVQRNRTGSRLAQSHSSQGQSPCAGASWRCFAEIC